MWTKPQIYAMPVFDMIETVLVKKLDFEPSFMLRFITRTTYVGESSKTWFTNESDNIKEKIRSRAVIRLHALNI